MIDFIKEKKILVLIIIAIVVIIVGAVRINSNGKAETTSPVLGDLIRTVKISGKVTPTQSVALGFETSGTVASVTKDVGDPVSQGEVIARIDSSGISSNILKAKADLALAQANLDKLGGTGTYEAQIDNARKSLIQTMVDTYTASNDAVHNKTDQFLLNPRSNKPELLPALNSSPDLRNTINKKRVTMEETLDTWRALTGKMGSSTYTYTETDFLQARKYFSDVFSYISDISQAANLFESDAYLTQTVIDGYKTNTIQARDALNSASQDLISAEDNLSTLLLEVPVQVASVEATRATLLNYQSQLSKTYLISPINGIISKQDAKIGQVVSANDNLVSIISEGFEVEAFVPEVLISGVRVGNQASVTLDAYGDKENFETIITHIDPAETIRDGVSTYKIKLIFNSPDDRIRSGMTANINIETFRKNGVVLIPERTVVRENDETFVYILSGDRQEKTPVTIGDKDSFGNVELISELPSKGKFIINPTTD